MISARDAVPGSVYRAPSCGPGTYFLIQKPGVAQRLAKKLAKLGLHMRMDQFTELQAAREVIAGLGVLAIRYHRGKDPLTGERYELRAYVALPNDYRLREVKRKPGY